MAGRKQVGQVLNKYFSGFHSSLSVELLVNALELHYEGFSQDSNAILTQGITDLIAQCGQESPVEQLRALLQQEYIKAGDQTAGGVATDEGFQAGRKLEVGGAGRQEN